MYHTSKQFSQSTRYTRDTHEKCNVYPPRPHDDARGSKDWFLRCALQSDRQYSLECVTMRVDGYASNYTPWAVIGRCGAGTLLLHVAVMIGTCEVHAHIHDIIRHLYATDHCRDSKEDTAPRDAHTHITAAPSVLCPRVHPSPSPSLSRHGLGAALHHDPEPHRAHPSALRATLSPHAAPPLRP